MSQPAKEPSAGNPPPGSADPTSALALFSRPVRTWFGHHFAQPTAVQAQTWQAVAHGKHCLVVAPTGSGKTLAAFLWAIDQLTSRPSPDAQQRCRVLYISPLKALAVDVERNLTQPLAGIAAHLTPEDPDHHMVTIGVRTGDTPAAVRRKIGARPPDILITTPESLFLMLTSAQREVLSSVETVIIDEVHAVAGSKRGAHLAVSLERLSELCHRAGGGDPQRIGLSATVRPPERVASFLGGDRQVDIINPESSKRWDLEIQVPVADLNSPTRTRKTGPAEHSKGRGSSSRFDPESATIWPHITEQILDLVEKATSTIVFVNSRRLAERLTTRLNELHGERMGTPPPADAASPADMMAQSGMSLGQGGPYPIIARSHHGSVSKEQRQHTEELLKSGNLPCVVATSSLELGIDMGAVELVIQLSSPPSVASGLQRVGRAGHQVGVSSRGVFFPQFRGDLLETAVVADRMRRGLIEHISLVRNPLDVLAQHLVSLCAMDSPTLEQVWALLRRSAPFRDLSRSALESVVDMLTGRYPSEEFAELRPRLIWHRESGRLEGRPGSQRLAVTNGGTIPDRGLFGVHLLFESQTTEAHEVAEAHGTIPHVKPVRKTDARTSRRVGELDEEMVYESRIGDVITLGTTSWRVAEITHDQVRVTPAPGVPGRLPFWTGDTPYRPAELGQGIGAFVREVTSLDEDQARAKLADLGLDPWAVDNVVSYLAEQRNATGVVPHDQLIVVERFRDPLGDWRICLHSSMGGAVLTPWAMAIQHLAQTRYGLTLHASGGNDGIVIRVPDTTAAPPSLSHLVLDPDEISHLIHRIISDSALFASRFRECAARALLLPRRSPGARSPLWQQRLRSQQLLSVAAKFPDFPIMVEAARECLADVFDLAGLITLHRDIAEQRIQIIEVETPRPSPFARTMLFGYVGEFIYATDAPLAERRAAALSLDTTALAELIGGDQARQLLDPEVIAEAEADLQCLSEDRKISTTEQLFDLVRMAGPYSTAEVRQRWSGTEDPTDALMELASNDRVVEVNIAGTPRWAVVHDLDRLRAVIGPALGGVPDPEVSDPLGDLVLRWTRTHVLVRPEEVAHRYGLGVAVVGEVLHRLVGRGDLVHAELDPELSGRQFCHSQVLAMVKRRSLAALRRELEPVPAEALVRFLPRWHQVVPVPESESGSELAAPEASTGDSEMLWEVLAHWGGLAVPWSSVESALLPARIPGYTPRLLDELLHRGEIYWVGAGRLGPHDGLIRFLSADSPPPPHDQHPQLSDAAAMLWDRLSGGGSWTVADLCHGDDSTISAAARPAATLEALWELAWAGLVTTDSAAPLRHLHSRTTPAHPSSLRRPHRRLTRPVAPRMPSLPGRWSAIVRPADSPAPSTHSTPADHTSWLVEETLALLDRHGVVVKGSAQADDFPGGWAMAYRVLCQLEDAGTCRRGYAIAGLGPSQFALPGVVDQLRSVTQPCVDVMSACDPANPFGAALPWPAREGHRPSRQSGALVVLVDGVLACYLARGAHSLLTFTDGPQLDRGLRGLVTWLSRPDQPPALVQRIDQDDSFSHRWRDRCLTAGAELVPQGLRFGTRSG